MSPRGARPTRRTGGRSRSAGRGAQVQTEAPAVAPPEPSGVGVAARAIEIPRTLTVKELGDLLGISPVEVIKERLKARLEQKDEPSDARWEIFHSQKAAFQPIRPDEESEHRLWDSTEDPDIFLVSLVRELMFL